MQPAPGAAARTGLLLRDLSDTEKQYWLDKFAPVCRFDEQEKHFPVSAEYFIQHSDLYRRLKKENPNARHSTQFAHSRSSLHSFESDYDPEGQAHAAALQGQKPPKTAESLAQQGWEFVALPDGLACWGVQELLASLDQDTYKYKLDPAQKAWGGQGTRSSVLSNAGGKLQPMELQLASPLRAEARSRALPRVLGIKHLQADRHTSIRCMCLHKDISDGGASVPCYGFAQMLSPHMILPSLRRAGLCHVLELKYTFLYGYNGSSFVVKGTPIGVHAGDMEHVTVRVDCIKEKLLEVHFAAHATAEGKWIPTSEFYHMVLQADPHTLGDQEQDPLGYGDQRTFLQVDEPVHGGPAEGPVHTSTRPVVFPARQGHASYPEARKWHRFTLHQSVPGFGDDVSMGAGLVWRPSVVQLSHPKGNSPAWMQYKGLWGEVSGIPRKSYWLDESEELRKCSAEHRYRSLLEDGIIPDRSVKLGRHRNLQGHSGCGVVLEQHVQVQHWVMLVGWTSLYGMAGEDKPADQYRGDHLTWLHPWKVVKDPRPDYGTGRRREAGTTDDHGWMYKEGWTRGDTLSGLSGRPRKGLRGAVSRKRVWVRMAATPSVAEDVRRVAQREQVPLEAVAVAALHLADGGVAPTRETLGALLAQDPVLVTLVEACLDAKKPPADQAARRRSNSWSPDPQQVPLLPVIAFPPLHQPLSALQQRAVPRPERAGDRPVHFPSSANASAPLADQASPPPELSPLAHSEVDTRPLGSTAVPHTQPSGHHGATAAHVVSESPPLPAPPTVNRSEPTTTRPAYPLPRPSEDDGARTGQPLSGTSFVVPSHYVNISVSQPGDMPQTEGDSTSTPSYHPSSSAHLPAGTVSNQVPGDAPHPDLTSERAVVRALPSTGTADSSAGVMEAMLPAVSISAPEAVQPVGDDSGER